MPDADGASPTRRQDRRLERVPEARCLPRGPPKGRTPAKSHTAIRDGEGRKAMRDALLTRGFPKVPTPRRCAGRLREPERMEHKESKP